MEMESHNENGNKDVANAKRSEEQGKAKETTRHAE